ncbi:MAG TPA: lipoyl synthase [Armatimonadota bacterium]|nr:lipoyl synthase [Armatimonadota bacterium]
MRHGAPTGRPEWLRVVAPRGENYRELKQLVHEKHLHTVCESARCPNIGECWQSRTATFLILGNTCTRGCAFCAVTAGKPTEYDTDEPRRVAEAVADLQLRYAVITSVTRDDLDDGGAAIFADTIRRIHATLPDCRVEVLIPDFQGDHEALATVVNAKPDVLNHNIETVQRLYTLVRPKASYRRTLDLLAHAKEIDHEMVTKSGIMVGLGETTEEIEETLRDLRAANCDIVTIGQYLRPSTGHVPVQKYYEPDEFARFADYGNALGFQHVESAPLVRSSYHARQQAEEE